MGGTSTDVALVHDLAPRMSHDNQIDAYPLKMPQLDIHTIGDIEIVNVRLVSIGEVDKPVVDFAPAGSGDPVIERRPVWFGEWCETPVVDRERLAGGWRAEGPAIVEEAGGTTVARRPAGRWKSIRAER